ncbi:MAG TPA: IS3 family transposase, partial [Rhodospirillaceae bacterium]|nr:IS3 family transposase [Rhodospirillaceae bacterium]
QTLERVSRDVGYPKTIRVDNGSEFIMNLQLTTSESAITKGSS